MSNHNNSSVETFNRFVEERYRDLINKMSELINALAGDDKQNKVSKAKIAFEASNSLSQALAVRDRPQWLQPISNTLQNYINHNGHQNVGNELINTIGLFYGAATNHKWAFDFSDDKGFDFDGVFKKYESESQIPMLFDKIVEILEKIVKCEQLDSRKIIVSLEKIIATLKKNRDGSYFSMMASWNFAITYLKNVAWNALLEIPGLNVLVNSLRETLDETNKEMEKLNSNMQDDLHKQLHAEFPVLKYNALPIPKQIALTNDSVVDVDVTPAGGPGS
ncbi:MAG: hypothetical protein IT426_05880 [Pirellulales bacterium]|nr:hypothetical protein [Pirellulales bacterium]